MHGGEEQVSYNPADSDVSVIGLPTLSVVEAAHFSRTRFPCSPVFVCTNAI
jgi:hypothetical protein